MKSALLDTYGTWSGRWILISDSEIHLDAGGLIGCFYRTIQHGSTTEPRGVEQATRSLAQIGGARRRARGQRDPRRIAPAEARFVACASGAEVSEGQRELPAKGEPRRLADLFVGIESCRERRCWTRRSRRRTRLRWMCSSEPL
jgi:hypothetical protein